MHIAVLLYSCHVLRVWILDLHGWSQVGQLAATWQCVPNWICFFLVNVGRVKVFFFFFSGGSLNKSMDQSRFALNNSFLGTVSSRVFFPDRPPGVRLRENGWQLW